MPVQVTIPSLGDKFQDYRDPIPGDSYNWGPVIVDNQVKYFAIHHSVTPQTAKNDGNWKAECDKIANLHLARGFGGIGYRFVIASNGVVAYVGDLSHGGSAVGNNNHIIFSACLIGDFTKELPTAWQVHAAYLLTKHFLFSMPQYPQINSWDDIIGHKDAKELLNLPGAEPTACPGSNWRVGGDTLRDRIINDRWNGYPDPKPTVTPPPQPPVDQCAPQNAKIAQLQTEIKLLLDDKQKLIARTEELSQRITNAVNDLTK